ncbi:MULTISPECIES: cardiolipin synthase ClsB [Pigmentiphaga]|uniref:Cardiolipin synthase B n=1 Tax=Pigmentiphaga daeguensis TaxID=414049 RepID=A0ABN1CKY0_9BURK|nr:MULTISPECIES: cardiolipin synthase ClsB [unclassified Pigmentiphaga]OVZ62913.1 cardiolipin synthase B [Pigmentiphaga sp. NML030171]
MSGPARGSGGRQRGPRRPPASTQWMPGNAVSLLENGEAFFPRVFEVIRGARREVLLETFILFEDKVGLALREVLLDAARRGVFVSVLVDGYGSVDLSEAFLADLIAAGVHFRVFDPRPKLLGMRTNVFRRMHRKLLIVDGETAFVGGINFSADHLADFGPSAKQDYAIEVRGPIVARLRSFVRTGEVRRGHPDARPGTDAERAGDAECLFVVRDNDAHRTDIEQHYRIAIRAARRDLTIANAYFFPGYRLLRDLRHAARRGVRVRLILQGEPDMPIVKVGARMLHDYLLDAGVKIYEYCERPLHGKVAVADDDWSTVGSSNLDPLSLSLNLEANLVIRDQRFNQVLRERLDTLVSRHCREVKAVASHRRPIWRAAASFLAFHFLRRFPAWAGWLPAHTPKLEKVEAPPRGQAEPPDAHSRQTG